MNKNKVLLISIIGMFLVSVSSAYIVGYSNPTYRDGTEIIYSEPKVDNRSQCIKEEWGQNFDNFRAGDISKEDMIKYVRSCKW